MRDKVDHHDYLAFLVEAFDGGGCWVIMICAGGMGVSTIRTSTRPLT